MGNRIGDLRLLVDEIEILNLLIEKYDEEHNTFDDADPIELLKFAN